MGPQSRVLSALLNATLSTKGGTEIDSLDYTIKHGNKRLFLSGYMVGKNGWVISPFCFVYGGLETMSTNVLNQTATTHMVGVQSRIRATLAATAFLVFKGVLPPESFLRTCEVNALTRVAQANPTFIETITGFHDWATRVIKTTLSYDDSIEAIAALDKLPRYERELAAA